MNATVRLFISLALSLFVGHAGAAVYYIDASAGSDRDSGLAPVRKGSRSTNGPWQTLERVSAAALKPGDSVLLKCGEVWHEPLRLAVSGASANPIKVGAYPTPCANRPTIDGSFAIPGSSWSPYAGRIFRAKLPVDLIADGSFGTGFGGWGASSRRNDALILPEADCGANAAPCLGFVSGMGNKSSIVHSDDFAIDGATKYKISFALRAPSGVRVNVVLRRSAGSDADLGLAAQVDGSGAWQTYTYDVTASDSVRDARLEFEVPPRRVKIGLDDVRVAGTAVLARQLFADGEALAIAHHPNRGHDSLRPQSPYLPMAEDADRRPSGGELVSTYLSTGPDLVLPAGAAIGPGVGVRVLTNAWLIDERSVAAVVGRRLYFDRPSSFALERGWGYYLVGALWMLDEPGEWYFDAAKHELYVWMPDGAAPGERVAVGFQDTAIDVSRLANVVIDGLAVRRVGTGVRMRDSNAVALRNSAIADTEFDGVDAVGARGGVIEGNEISRAGRDAVVGADFVNGGIARGLHISGNEINESGVRLKAGQIVSLPVKSFAAIHAGEQASVVGNTVRNANYIGVRPMTGTTVSDNTVENTCLVLDDCAGIYTNDSGSNSTISGNLVVRAVGNLDGKPPGEETQAQGIYLDDLATNVWVVGNTVVDADFGIQLHNANNNRIHGNTLYGNRRNQVWLQEDSNRSRAKGDVYGNEFMSNRMFPTAPGLAIVQNTIYASTAAFATYDHNRYSSLLSARMANERWTGGSARHTLPQWKQARTSNGTPRNLDRNATEVTGDNAAAFQVAGVNKLFNGDFAGGTARWGAWNETAPYSQSILESCVPGRCLRFVAGASTSLLSSPNFSVAQDGWYRVAFDLKTGVGGQHVTVGVRRGGGGNNGYEWLQAAAESVSGSTAWQRYAFVFKATATVNEDDPITLDNGARIDFADVQPGQTITVANVQVVPLNPVDSAMKSRILLNPNSAGASLRCPDDTTDPHVCGRYLRFSDGAPLVWPYALPARGSEIIYARFGGLADADGDGITDAQDTCPGSPPGAPVNAAGCAFSQSYR